jgi:hypothetical protein
VKRDTVHAGVPRLRKICAASTVADHPMLELLRRDQARSNRSRFITLVQAATKSFTNFCFESAQA